LALQLPQSGSQLARVHIPAAQPAVAWGRLHALLQPPQLAGSLAMFTSQPFGTLPSQLAKPAEQDVTPQTPCTHDGAAFAGAHAALHPPQLARSVAVFVSHPVATTPSQSAQVPLQPATVHRPAAQPAVPFKTLHA
jgi:hypothetical protein